MTAAAGATAAGYRRAQLVQTFARLVHTAALIPPSDATHIAAINATVSAALATEVAIKEVQSLLFGNADVGMPSTLKASNWQRGLWLENGCASFGMSIAHDVLTRRNPSPSAASAELVAAGVLPIPTASGTYNAACTWRRAVCRPLDSAAR